jgi:6-phosphogluconolactonase (cycloisomerase 2 family)
MRRLLVLALLLVAVGPPCADAETIPWRGPLGMTISPDGRNLYATGERTLTFARNPDTGHLTLLDGTSPYGRAVAVTPDGRFVYIGDDGGGIHILARDAGTGILTHVGTYTGAPGTPLIGQVTGVAISPDGAQLYITQMRENAVIAFRRDATTGALTYYQVLFDGPSDLPHLGYPTDFAMTSDGRFLYVAGNEYVSEFSRDPATGALTAGDATQSRWSAGRLAVAADGKRVYAGSTGYESFDRDPTTGALTPLEQLTSFEGHEGGWPGGPIWVSPDSASVFSVQALDWRFQQATATASGTTPAHTYAQGGDGIDQLLHVSGVAWSADGRFLYLVTGDFTQASVLTFAWDGSRLTQVGRVDPTIQRTTGLPPGVTPGLSIADGAIYVNDPDVTLHVVPPMWDPASLRISNDPSFASADLRRIDPSGRYAWHLDRGELRDRSVKHVYVRFTSDGRYPATTFSDDVILDQVAPQVLSAKVRRSRLLVHAKDNRSGVKKLQLASDKRHPQRARRFTGTVKLQHVPKRLWVRVVDGAGNKSRWRGAKR